MSNGPDGPGAPKSQESLPIAQIRVGHAERDLVATILQQAVADGRLSIEELDERLEAALRAKTYADLDPLVADLTVDLPWRPSRPPAPQPRQGPPPPGYSRDDPLRLDGGASSEKRGGPWVVPPFLRISTGVGSVKLNCLEAIPAAPLIEVEVIPGAGSALIILPSGWAVDADRLGKAIGSKTVKVPQTPAPGQPVLVLYGSVGIGSLKVRPGSARELRRVGGGNR